MSPTPRPRAERTLARGPYLVLGALLFGLKHNLDRIVASAYFGRSWSFFNYLVPPEQGSSLLRLTPQEVRFYGTLLLLAVPFIVVGVVLTLRRLRSAGLPEPLVVLFFVPLVNLAFFLLLCVVPARDAVAPSTGRVPWLARAIPIGVLGSALAAVGLTVLFGLGVVLFGVQVLERYGWGLFVGLPFAMGLFAALIHGYHTPRGRGECLAVALLAPSLLAAALVLFAVEGFVCLLMAGIIAIPLAALGGYVGYFLQLRPAPRSASPALLVLVALSAPALMGAEHASPPAAPLLAVTTAEEIDAPPDIVWRHVVAFSELAPPTEWIFRAGVAYPMRATIDGSGPGAVRHCIFSTGAFEEPITVWDDPHRLAFDVRAQPAPLQEWTPWRHLEPLHLNGYLRSERGEFRLAPRAGGGTRLEGTTWYRHELWPAAYWQLWSDAIIHRIHARVLQHIRREAEAETRAAAVS